MKPLLIVEHSVEGVLRSALQEVELVYPGVKLQAEIELTDKLTVLIKIYPESDVGGG